MEVSNMDQNSCFDVIHYPEMGRCLIATKDLEMGEIIFEEYPLVTGPIFQDGLILEESVICFECYKETEFKCKYCGVPLCQSHDLISYINEKQHTKAECDLMSGIISNGNNSLKTEILSHLFFLRCFELKPEKLKLLLNLASNYEQWSKSALSNEFHSHLKLLKTLCTNNYCKLPSDDEQLEIVKAIQDINSYEIKLSSCNIQVTFYKASFLEHNCVPNTHRITNSDDLKLTVRAAIKIAKGTHLTTSYSDLFWPTIKRQMFFQNTKFFHCKCKRCLDPTECDSYLSAFLCSNCPADIYSPVIPIFSSQQAKEEENVNQLEEEFKIQNYKCMKCNMSYEVKLTELILNEAKMEYYEIEAITNNYEDIDEAMELFMKFLCKWTDPTFFLLTNNSCRKQLANSKLKKLHPQNTLILDVVHSIFLLISVGNNSDLIESTDASQQMIELKIKLGKHLLKSTESITSGICKFRCTVLADLAKTEIVELIILLKINGNKKDENSVVNIKEKISKAMGLWKEGLDCLQYEPNDSSEGVFYRNGLEEYKKYLDHFKHDFFIN